MVSTLRFRPVSSLPTRAVGGSCSALHSRTSEHQEVPMTDQASLAPVQAVSNALSDVVASAAPAVVSVHSHRSRSSGFAWRQGLIVTADESLADDGEVSVRLPSGQSVPAKIAGRDPTTDIALLRAEAAELTTANLDTPAVAVGALALAVGATDDGTTAA